MNDNTLLIVLLLAGVGIGVYFLMKPTTSTAGSLVSESDAQKLAAWLASNPQYRFGQEASEVTNL